MRSAARCSIRVPRRWRTPSGRPSRDWPHRDRRLRTRVPRTHQPDDGADLEEYASIRRDSGPFAPRSIGLPLLPYRDHRDGPGRSSRDHPDRTRDQAPITCRDDRGADRRRSGFIVPADGFLPTMSSSAPTTASPSSPTRYRPASAAPARCSPSTTRAWCPTW